jgi:TonB family protein
VRVGGAIRQPTKTKHVDPVYPSVAQFANVEGVVIIEATIGAGGKVEDAKVLRSIPLLDAAALTAVRQWEYTPTLLNGVPVPVIMTVTVNFTLQGGPSSGLIPIISVRGQDGAVSRWEMPLQQVNGLAPWNSRMGPPPLSMDEAVRAAEAWLKQRVPGAETFQLSAANLARIQPDVLMDRWFYFLVFDSVAADQSQTLLRRFMAVVLLDGSVVDPRVDAPAASPTPQPPK